MERTSMLVMRYAVLLFVIITISAILLSRPQINEGMLEKSVKVAEDMTLLFPGTELWKGLIPYAKENPTTHRVSVTAPDGWGNFYELSFGIMNHRGFRPNIQLYFESQQGSHRIDKPLSRHPRVFAKGYESWVRVRSKNPSDTFIIRETTAQAITRIYVAKVMHKEA